MPVTISGTNGVTFPDSSLQAAAASPYVLKNRIINGDMVIDQRRAGASVTPTSDDTYTLDRWQCGLSQASKYSVQQQTSVVPTGYTYATKITSLSSYSLSASDYFIYTQKIEGFNTADFSWGTANAKTVTLSFQVYSSLTGTFGGAIHNAAANRSYPFSYTISSANTWTTISITIPGDTSGTWLTTNGIGMWVRFGLGVGSTYSGTANTWANTLYASTTGATSVVGTNGATWYLTGVQLEVGSSATPFERRMYGQELALCQRYYITVGGDTVTQTFTMMQAYSTTGFNGGTVPFPVKMRTIPTFSYSALSDFYVQNSAGGAAIPTAITQSGSEASTMCGAIKGTVSSGLTAGNASSFLASSINARLNFSAEL